jgi:hypothetical protein
MGIRLPENYTELSDEELLDLKQRIEQELDHVKTQIDRAKVDARNGTYSDPDWFARVNGAKRGIGRASQAIQVELGRRKGLRKATNIEEHSKQELTFERMFMRVARRKLTEEVYEAILQEAQEEVDLMPSVKRGYLGNINGLGADPDVMP